MKVELGIFICLVILSFASAQIPDCPENVPGIIFYPDPEDCNKYYECHSGFRYHMQCGAHLYWNIKEDTCDYLENVDCGNRPIPTNEPTSPTVSTTPSYDPNPQCPQNDPGITFYPDPSDCKQYFECNRGQRFTIVCPRDLLYNVNEQACDYPEHVTCVGRSTPVHTTATAGTTTSTSPPTTPPPSSTTPSYDPDPQCPPNDQNITFYPDPSDCKQYFECNRGQRFTIVCPRDLLYNVNEQACDYPEHVTCVGRSTPVHTTTTPTSPTTTRTTTPATTTPNYDPNPQCPSSSSKNVTFYADPSDCKNYFMCNRGERFTMTCPDILLWNVYENACDFAQFVDCAGRSTPVYTTTTPSGPTQSTTPNPSCQTFGRNISFSSDPSDCKNFFMCNRGTRFSMVCPDELVYNPDVVACDFPDVTDCTGRGTTPVPTSPPTTQTPRTTPSTTTIDPSGGCWNKPDGSYVGNPYNCTIFYECERGNGTARYCPNDLWWCQQELTCDFPHKNGCSCYVE